MKRILAVLLGLALVLSLAACSQGNQTQKNIPYNKLNQREKTALNFTENLYSGNKSKQYAAIDRFTAKQTISSLKEKISAGKFQQTFHAVEVLKGVNVKSGKGNEFLVLLEMKDQKNVTNKRIVVMAGDKVLHILSGNSKTYAKELGS